MKFIKDILFFDLTTTGTDVDKDNVIQIAAVLLKKENLLETNFFSSYIRVSYLDSFINAHAAILNIAPEIMRKSPKVYDAVKAFHAYFGNDFLLATGNSHNTLFLKNAFKKASVPFDYDSKVLDLWTLGYVYTLNNGLKKMPSMTTFADYLGLKLKSPSDALERVRLQAEIFRRIIKGV